MTDGTMHRDSYTELSSDLCAFHIRSDFGSMEGELKVRPESIRSCVEVDMWRCGGV
jgi:hypothetical protein